jgi:hypothetical protein
MKKLFNRIFAYETMNGAGMCPVYLERWTLFYRFGIGIYVHHFLADDWAIDPHDHPRRFISIGLKGWYYEDVFQGDGERSFTRKYSAPWCRTFPANHLHRVRASECGNVWTLVIVLRKSRPWGFVREGKWIPFKDYVFGGKARKSCQ